MPTGSAGPPPPQVVKTEPMRVITNHRDSDEPQQSLKVWKAGLAAAWCPPVSGTAPREVRDGMELGTD